MRPWYVERFDKPFFISPGGFLVKYFEITKVNFDEDKIEGLMHMSNEGSGRHYELQFYGGPVYATNLASRVFEYHEVTHTSQIEVVPLRGDNILSRALDKYLTSKVHDILTGTLVGFETLPELDGNNSFKFDNVEKLR